MASRCLIGILNGILIAYVEIPAIFATLAMGTFIYGLGHFALVDNDTIFVGDQLATFKQLGAAISGDIPASVIWAAVIAVLAFLLLRFTKIGRFIYAMGDNPRPRGSAAFPCGP